MIKPEDIIALLDRNKARVKRISGDDGGVGGFALIIPPEGDPIEILMQGTEPTQKAFYEYMIGRIADRQKDATEPQGPYIGARGGGWR